MQQYIVALAATNDKEFQQKLITVFADDVEEVLAKSRGVSQVTWKADEGWVTHEPCIERAAELMYEERSF